MKEIIFKIQQHIEELKLDRDREYCQLDTQIPEGINRDYSNGYARGRLLTINDEISFLTKVLLENN